MQETIFQGIAAADGIAIGNAFFYAPIELTIPDQPVASAAVEFQRFQTACQTAKSELAEIQVLVEKRAGAENAAIFGAHAMMLEDPTLHDAVREQVWAGKCAEAAVNVSIDDIAAILAAMEDEYFAARAVDLKDVGRRIVRILLGKSDTSLAALHQPAVVIAHDLTPSDTAQMHPELVLGFCTAAGGLTSHSSILARSLGIPAVVGIGQAALAQIQTGDQLVVSGTAGSVVLHPAPETVEHFCYLRQLQEDRMSSIQAHAAEETRTPDGQRVEVAANIGDLDAAHNAVEYGAEGVGLLRTEFLYLQDTAPPSEERQIAIYRSIFEAMDQKPVVVRTLDIGGDKPPSYLHFPAEQNPFLGWRAIRYCLENLPLFKTQLRAILRAAVGHRALIMFPMISAVDELHRAKTILEEVIGELETEGLDYARGVPVGIMVETPAAAVMADALAKECDFFSLGTNDLTQYTLAVDRGNERVAHLFHPLHPAVLRLVRQTIELAHTQCKWVGMCGELAGMKKAIPILLGLGLDEFSMVPRAIPEAKWIIRQLTMERAREIAAHALTLCTADDVDVYMSGILAELGEGKPA